jgi:hypothetical protein
VTNVVKFREVLDAVRDEPLTPARLLARIIHQRLGGESGCESAVLLALELRDSLHECIRRLVIEGMVAWTEDGKVRGVS